jgi:hypothetical protein
MIAEQDAPLTVVDQLDRVFNAVAETYQELWLIRQIEMPDDILSESFTRFTERIAALNRIAQEQASQHERDARIRARAERVRNRRQQRDVIPTQPPAPLLTLIDPSLVPIETPIVPLVVIAHTPVSPPPVSRARVLQNANPAQNRADANAERLREVARPFHISTGCLTKKEQATPMPDVCGICLDGYTMIDSVRTNCGHTFCKTCFNQHETNGLNKTQPRVDCPFCRTLVKMVFAKRARKTPVRRPKPVNEAPTIEPSTIIE